jgi:hypothetical protein
MSGVESFIRELFKKGQGGKRATNNRKPIRTGKCCEMEDGVYSTRKCWCYTSSVKR